MKNALDDQEWTQLGTVTFLGERDGAQLVEADDGTQVLVKGYGRLSDAERGDRMDLWKRVAPNRAWTQLFLQPSSEPRRTLPALKERTGGIIMPGFIPMVQGCVDRPLGKPTQPVVSDAPIQHVKRVRRKK